MNESTQELGPVSEAVVTDSVRITPADRDEIRRITGQEGPDRLRVVHGELKVSAARPVVLLGPGDSQVRVKLRFLLEVSDSGPLGDLYLAHIICIDAGHNAQQRGFPGSVSADHADFCTEKESECYIVEHNGFVVLFG